mgnify:FL=1
MSVLREKRLNWGKVSDYTSPWCGHHCTHAHNRIVTHYTSPVVWPWQYTCAQPYHPGGYQATMDSCFGLDWCHILQTCICWGTLKWPRSWSYIDPLKLICLWSRRPFSIIRLWAQVITTGLNRWRRTVSYHAIEPLLQVNGLIVLA